MARHDEQQPAQVALAGLGWTQDLKDGRGLFVELHGTDRADVERRIQATLGTMIASRPYAYGPIYSEIAEIPCRGLPVCAVAIAVYKSQGWND
jgi:arginine decarboxylase